MPRRLTQVTEAESAEALEASELDLEPIREIVAERHSAASDLIPLLQRVQAHYGYLPVIVVAELARITGIPESRIYGVITFYAQFSLTPSGRSKVCVCQGTACHVRGAHGVLRAVEGTLGIKPGETAEDLSYSLKTVACLGACSLAPVVTVDGQYFGKLTASKVTSVLAEHKGGGDE